MEGFSLSPAVAAETGIHIGDGSLRIKRGGPHGVYQYSVTGHALEDQLYLVGTVMPTVSAAYGPQRPGFYINPERTWASLSYQNKALALFKHETLGLPNGRKLNLSIPKAIREDASLMRHFARELLATDGLLGFYSASKEGRHKYPRIQVKMTAAKVIDDLASFLGHELGVSPACRNGVVTYRRWRRSLQLMVQISRQKDIDTWRKKIGFSNPSHISRMMMYEAQGECLPGTNIVNRLASLSRRSSNLSSLDPIAGADPVTVLDKMRLRFGFPMARPSAILQTIDEINTRLNSTLGRRLPILAQN